VCERSFRRYIDRYEEEGLKRLIDHRVGQISQRRDRAPLPGMMLRQDGRRHEWVGDQRWDLIVTMDDATHEHYAMQFVEEEATRLT
jgi:hypothetical protein